MKVHYDRSVLKNSNRVSLNVKNAPVNSLLNEITEQTGLQFAVLKDKLIVEGGAAKQVSVKGTVKDAQGQPLPGVSVIIKGTTKGTSTGPQGTFTISAQPTDILVFSFVGFQKQEVTVGSRTTLNVVLKEDATALSEVVVTSLGIQRQQKSLGYAVSTVSSKEITQAGNTNFASALYGKAAGVKITTAPGGASSAVNVQIRGINSLNFNTQPLYVVDGVMIRNAEEKNVNPKGGEIGLNNGGYWDDQRIRGNGILDINPNDIESLTVLKGASATALYGSDAASGVIVITTKKGSKERGFGVDFNYVGNVEKVAFTPRFQNEYGPGYDMETRVANNTNEEGMLPVPGPNGTVVGYRPWFSAWANFGPKLDGRMITWWDGVERPLSPQPDNYKDIFRTGFNSNLNVAVSNQTDKVNYRFSASRNDYKGIQRGGKYAKNTFNLNSSLKLSDKISTDVIVSYVNTQVHNRPYQINRLTASYDGFFNRSDDMNLFLQKYQTSEGYKWVGPSDSQRNPQEAFLYNTKPEILNFFWNQLKNNEDEDEDRFLSTVTLNWELVKNLKFRGRVGNDFTTRAIQKEEFNEYPIAFNGTSSSTGNFSVSKGRYSVFYGDALLTYSNKLFSDLDFTVSGGFQGRDENYRDQFSGTQAGLVTANWFTLNNSYGILSTTATRASLLKYAYLGILNLSFKDYLFLEGTARQEYASSLPPANNHYFYPSVNAGFVFSDAFKLPDFMSYGKLRASYGIVGNAPPMYRANILYNQISLQSVNGSVPSLTLPSKWGNNQLEPEKKYEMEFGLESKFMNDRIGVDLSVYNSRVKKVIMDLNTAPTIGATSQIVNAGEIRSSGIEIALNATPVSGKFRWDTRFNYAFNKSKVESLAPGIERLSFYDADQSAIRIFAEPGQEIGNIYVYPLKADASGTPVINSLGYYTIDKTQYKKAGNIMPKAVGGFSNTLSFKNVSLDFMIDYRFGGKMISTPLKYALSAGLYENSMQYRDEAHGGLPYYVRQEQERDENGVPRVDGNGQPVMKDIKTLLPTHNASAPNGTTVYHDGVIIPGVTENGEENKVVVDAAGYYINSFYWGSDAYNERGAIYKNNYIKLREVTLSFRLPSSISNKMKVSNMRISLIGRNLFYLHRTLKDLDPEAPIGSQWYRQGIDEGSSASTRSFGFTINANF
ncbi:SusC/RagA family TonB-linked outer membrane protein [Pararcticibacter amylolyticus]|uniref:SusC/RagA family TonB-linked outer membrane protein n=2 Tax=Pararcticibacter amylolyticus TaxID=2173175 RepID=A0A2U2PFT3_9SPHI|nr:SusC/RagA family TonB-linked outer membrane protein [Pararcticibacter amylolyticus]